MRPRNLQGYCCGAAGPAALQRARAHKITRCRLNRSENALIRSASGLAVQNDPAEPLRPIKGEDDEDKVCVSVQFLLTASLHPALETENGKR